ncbi:PIN domain-containing protein [Halorussus amylolyticus]|uniref:PIN domain-containing protein n=1 Tax=Halorussus amylolyticus TaxID=1126242 RepID=UPI001050189F|nr:PIN domain-containing protein [Halorussus amylolyticus]
MLCLDNNLLGDYLDGSSDARRFLQDHETEPWAVSNIVLYEALMGSIHGYIGGDVATIRQAITSSMDVLDVTERTTVAAAELQEELLARGVPAGHPDALIAASAKEHGATFATAEKHFWNPEVREVLDVAEYDPY